MLQEDTISAKIKQHAKQLGFDACGFSMAEPVSDMLRYGLSDWLANSFHADMGYMANHFEKRCNPTILVDGARSIISVALNYYPNQKQATGAPQFAYYAYGQDYHHVMKDKLSQLFNYIKLLYPELQGRAFCDTAPILERYWTAKSGVGFVGKNSMLIVPGKGSYFFLGELVINLELDYDSPISKSCGSCSRCIDACPTGAITKEYSIDSKHCISYHTIENKGMIPAEICRKNEKYVFGCDICQHVCPWNRFAFPHETSELMATDEFLKLSDVDIDNMTEHEFDCVFGKSAVKRATYAGLKKNMEALKNRK